MAVFDVSMAQIDGSFPLGCLSRGAMSETAQQYIQRITANVEGLEPLEVQAATPHRLAQLIEGIPSSALRTRPSADAWSAGEIIAHLADAEIVIGFRMRLILGAPGTPIAAYDQDSWVSSGHYDQRDPHKSLEQLRVMREANLALLALLTPEQWQQYGVHSERGQETIEQLVRMTAGHDVNHLRQIERIVSTCRA
jgi:DinB family protein